MKRIVSIIFLSLITMAIFAEVSLRLEPNGYHFDRVKEGKIIKNKFSIINNGDEEVALSINSSCGCLVADHNLSTLKPGQSKEISYELDTNFYNGEMFKTIAVHFTDLDREPLVYQVYGEVKGKKRKDKVLSYTNLFFTNNFHYESVDNDYVLYYFSYHNCKRCVKVLNQIIKWAKEEHPDYFIHVYKLEDDINKKHLKQITDSIGYYPQLPLLLFNQKFYSGKKEVTLLVEGKETVPDPEKDKKYTTLNGSAIFFAGLLDGINPCVFTVILLLISYLTLQFKGGKKQILISGLLYIASVFVTYYLIGIGIFEFVRKIQAFRWISYLLKYGLTILLFLLAGLSLYDYIQIKKGRADRIFLKLPDFLQNSMRKNIRAQMKDYQIFSGSIILGFTVALFELACTGQVYLPIIGYMVRSSQQMIKGLLLLVVYNLAFIIPLLLIFILIYKGISSKKIEKYFQDNLTNIKLLFFILFNCFAVINILVY